MHDAKAGSAFFFSVFFFRIKFIVTSELQQTIGAKHD